jgi:hypothetical protein
VKWCLASVPIKRVLLMYDEETWKIVGFMIHRLIARKFVGKIQKLAIKQALKVSC